VPVITKMWPVAWVAEIRAEIEGVRRRIELEDLV